MNLHTISLSLILTISGLGSTVWSQVPFEKPPISYGQSEPSDRVAQLAKALRDQKASLEYSDEHGWLPSLLEALDINQDSQLLVFSKTSLQLHKISPTRPRAIYFNDDVYVGWCQRGDLLEIAATDPELGAVFYTIDQHETEQAQIKRDRGGCLTCHATYRTQGVPGFLVRSIYSDNNGRPRTGTRTYVTDHNSPFEQRFGGWYVSGTHGSMRHMGNVISHDRLDPETIDRDAGANQNELSGLCNTEPYLTSHSDLVALMVLEHQSQMHNLIARAGIECHIAHYQDRVMSEVLGRSLDYVSPSTTRRIESAGEKLVRYMLFADELTLEGPIEGSSKFTEQFQTRPDEPRDEQGRSLRDLDLKTRMFKYPCSYLIYTPAFDALPPMMADYVQNRLSEILTGEETPEGYERLSSEDRRAIREILDATKPNYIASLSAQP